MRPRAGIALAGWLWLAALPSCGPGASHVAANVPAADAFDRMMRRDVAAYFALIEGRRVRVEPTLLRRGATQVGGSRPKFYAWVRVLDDSTGVELQQGAVRLAAVDGREFQVTDFVSRDQIRVDPNAVDRVFPAALCAGIRERAHR